MSRRPSTPPSHDNPSYLSNLGASFMVAGPPTSEDHSTGQHALSAAPSYSVVRPSDLYATPQAPSEVAFNFSDDASTIRPEDSVSQMGRRLTGKRLAGPRAMDSSAPPPLPQQAIAEDADESIYQYIPPHMLEDDKSSVMPRGQQQAGLGGQGGKVSPLPPQPSLRAVPSPYATRQYAEDEDDFDRGHDPLNHSSSAALPLVPGAADMAGYQNEKGSNVAAYRPPVAGYAAVGANDEEDHPYAAYSRSRDADLESSMRSEMAGGRQGSAGGNPGLLGYVRSLRGSPASSYSGSRKDSYPPSFDIPNKMHNRGPSSIDIVEAQDDPSLMRKAPLWQRLFYDTTPNAIRIKEHQDGQGIQRPWACWVLTGVYVMVMIIELVRMAQITGSPIQTKPSFNVMIGPSGSVLINTGARFAGCQKFISNVTDIDWICLKDSNSATVTSASGVCTMSEVCGFGGFSTPQEANQSFRFILPIFLHAGIIHLLLNGLAQCFSSAFAERQMGTPKFLVIYFTSGIFGFILGSNFALVGQPSVGASGAIFGTHAAMLVDLLAHWNIEYRPKRKLLYLILEIIVGLALGLVPGVDNFAHLGGFLMGLLGSVLLFPIIHQSKRHRYIFAGLRVLALPLMVVLFVVLTRNFYTSDPSIACSWCRYLSCWPTSSNNHCKGTGLSSTTTSSSSFGAILSILASTFLLPLL